MSTTNSRLIATEPSTTPYPAYFGTLYQKSGAAGLGLPFEEFSAILQQIAERYLPPDTGSAATAEFCRNLLLEDLALARACAYGSEAAWEQFVNRYRQKLYHFAIAISREESAARELADSLYADLFGTRTAGDGGRISKLASYMGRGSLEGWLRTVLAQEYVNNCRRGRHLTSFDEHTETSEAFGRAGNDSAPPDSRLEQATDAALAELSAEERFILASYYLDGRTLAAIASLLRVHESTISRRIGKINARLKKRIVRTLRKSGMSAKEAEQVLQSDVCGLSVDVRTRLLQGKIR